MTSERARSTTGVVTGDGAVLPTPRNVVATRGLSRIPAGGMEVLLVAALYVAYSVTRGFANGALGPAEAHARDLLGIEHGLHLAWESTLNAFYVDHSTWSLLSDYWYCSAHYVLTPAILIWLYLRGPESYRPMRRALVLATAIALVLFLVLPTAPPRFVHGYVDIVVTHHREGWWGGTSTPQGLGWMTNKLAAFPSLHAGYALWVAIAVHLHARRRVVRLIGWATALMTAATVIGTANHWVLDVLAGWVIVIVAVIVTRGGRERRLPSPQPQRALRGVGEGDRCEG